MDQVQLPPEVEGLSLIQPQAYLGLFQIAWRRRSLLVLGLVIALLLGGLYYLQARPVYQSSAQVLVVRKQPNYATGQQNQAMNLLSFEDYLSTHQVIIRSPAIIEKAIENRDLQNLKCFADRREDELVEVIFKALSVSRTGKGVGSGTSKDILNISFNATDRQEAAVVLNAIIDSYKKFLDETYRNMSGDSLHEIIKTREDLEKKIIEQEAVYREWRQHAPLVMKERNGIDIRQEKLSGIDGRRAALMLRRTQLESYLQIVDLGLKNGTSRETLVALLTDELGKHNQEYTRHGPPRTLQDELFPLQQAEKKLIIEYGPNHPDVLALRKQIEQTKEYFAKPPAALMKGNEGTKIEDRAVPMDALDQHVANLKLELDLVLHEEQLLNDLFDKEHEKAQKLNSYEIQDEAYRDELDSAKKLRESLDKRIQDMGLVREIGGYDARILGRPEPGRKVYPSVLIIFPAAAVLGLLLGFGMAYLAEITDQSFRTPEEIRQRLRLPVVGYIPRLSPQEETLRQIEAGTAQLDPLLFSYYQTKSMESEAYRGVRTALYFSTQGEGHKVIQVTSPNPGDGKSTLAANLAVSIAQSGKRTLLIDGDLRKPRVHKVFGISAEVGLASVIVGEAEPGDAVQESAVPNLFLLPSGPIPPNPAELLTSPRFKELLALLREQYDFVIVDTPPLLAVTDPSVVAAQVDGVLLTIRRTKNDRPPAERARSILSTLGVNVIGVVINGADKRNDSGGYGYGYGYGYGKSHYYEETQTSTAEAAEGPK